MAIEVQLIDIYSKPSDFKICRACKRLNWYENETCINTDCTSNLFDDSEGEVEEAFSNEWLYWQDEEGYSEKEADRVFLEV